MGYCIDLNEANFTIPAEKVEEAFERLKALNHKPGVEKRGGSWNAGGQTASWFSWMDADYDEKVADIKELFSELGYQGEYDAEGNFSVTEFWGEKIGQEDLFFAEVSDLANDGWYMEYTGEDGYKFRYTAKGEVGATVTWGDDEDDDDEEPVIVATVTRL